MIKQLRIYINMCLKVKSMSLSKTVLKIFVYFVDGVINYMRRTNTSKAMW
jgi:hypothetical protein